SDSYLTKFNRYIKIQKKHEKVGSLSMNIHHMLKIQGKLQVNRNPLYSFLINFEPPDLKQSLSRPEIRQISGKTNKQVLTEDVLRKIIKGLEDEADITKFEVFYYPIWFVNLENRSLKIDGVTGKEI
ncbi:MAG: hypothetical protein O8C62_06800, partial [Candidatus Methanoperedens sp.]|nr:hypothetical protein [Candidatus Methanoperedens sp.]